MGVEILAKDIANMEGGKVTEEDIQNFWANGAVWLPSVVSRETLSLLAEGVKMNEENPGPYAERLKTDKDQGDFFNDYVQWTSIPPYEQVIRHSNLASVAGRLMKSTKVTFYHEHTLVKSPGMTSPTPWHHDQSYYPIEGKQFVSLWIPLDPIEESSSLQFVAGSHLWGKKFIPKKFEDQRNYGVEKEGLARSFPGQPNPDLSEKQRSEMLNEFESLEVNQLAWPVIQWACQPGDLVAFHGWTLHGGSPAPSAMRRVVSLRWAGDDCLFVHRPWVCSPPHSGGLVPNQSLHCSDFFPTVISSHPQQ